MAMTWLVNADSTSAKIYKIVHIGGEFLEIKQVLRPESQMKSSDLAGDRPGRSFDSAAAGRDTMVPHADPKDHEADVFAREVCRFIDHGRATKSFERLVVVAPPDFLGRLRSAISSATNKPVAESLAKNMVGCGEQEIRSRLESLI